MFNLFTFCASLQATSPQTGGQQQTGGPLKSLKDKSGQPEKDAQEVPALKTAGPDGEITAGLCRKQFPCHQYC